MKFIIVLLVLSFGISSLSNQSDSDDACSCGSHSVQDD